MPSSRVRSRPSVTPGPAGALRGGLLIGALADEVLGDPRRGHPVAGFGAVATRTERALYRDDRGAGALFATVMVGGAAACGAVVQRSARSTLWLTALTAAATWAVLGATSLRHEALAVRDLLEAGDLSAARARVRSLVGRDMSTADASQVSRAVVESVAENLSDALVAPLVWGAVCGVPGLLGYRAANTLDAMVGHRSERYARFGWASARLDDALNLLPARLTTALVAAVSGRPSAVVRVVGRDARGHPSPNAGWCEAAFAGALNVRLGGTNVYDGRVEHRPVMGDGAAPAPVDIARATVLAHRVGMAAVLVCTLMARQRR